MDIHRISLVYNVRKLSEEDIDDIYSLALENPMYYQYCPPRVTRESIRRDMNALPPGMTCQDKYYIGFWQGNQLIAVMDVILNYPAKSTAYIGFFMVNRSVQGRGTGSIVIEEFCCCMKSLGYTCVRLGYAKGNLQSRNFWMKNHFENTGVTYSNPGYDVIVMERTL